MITLIPLWFYFIWFIIVNHLAISFFQVILFIFFFLNSMILAFSFHLAVCALCILTTEIDHLIQIYRDLTNMARFPTDIYQKGIQAVLTYVIPIVILITIPAKILMGFLSWGGAILSLVISGLFFLFAINFWKFAIKRYSSASS